MAELDSQKPTFLSKIEVLIRQREDAQTAEEIRVQQKIQMLGRCPMNFNWIRQAGGWRCAGGSHFLLDKDVLPGLD